MKNKLSSSFSFILLIITILFQLNSGNVYARSINDGIGRTSLTWLKSVSDAGISSAGECLAARDGISSLLVHPAAVTGITSRTLKMSYVSHYVDTQYGSIGYAGLIKDRYVGIRLTYINYGEFTGMNIDNKPTGNFTAGDIGLSINVGKQLRDDLKIGAIATFITSKLDDFTAQAFTIDLGAIYTPPFEGLTVGAVLMNMGKIIKGYSSGYEETMPVYLSLGASKKLTHAPLTLFTDVIFANDYDITYAYGLEASIKESFFVYAGTKSRSKIDAERQKSKIDFSGIKTFGFGIELKSYRFDYAYCPDDNLEDIHKITLSGIIK